MGRLSPTGRGCHLLPSKGDEDAAFPPCFHLPPHPPCTHPSREQARGAGALIAALRGALLSSLPSCLSLGEGLAGCFVRILPPLLLFNDLIPFFFLLSPLTPLFPLNSLPGNPHPRSPRHNSPAALSALWPQSSASTYKKKKAFYCIFPKIQ